MPANSSTTSVYFEVTENEFDLILSVLQALPWHAANELIQKLLFQAAQKKKTHPIPLDPPTSNNSNPIRPPVQLELFEFD